jgi:threonine dehydrogenase-like Zn-dependent dehydrogenase
MLAGVYRGRCDVRAEMREVPEPAAGEVRLRVEACGLCGSDLHVYHGEPGRVAAGMTLGHEMVGVIDAVGAGVEGWRAGDRAAVEPLLSCGACERCAAGLDNLCDGYALIGLHRAGGFAERVVVPARRLYAVPAELDRRVAALAEPVAVCVHGLRRGAFRPEEPLLVLGAGSIGLLTLAVARRWGARDLAITARHPHQAALARALGATAIEPGELPGALLATTGEPAARWPLVIETVGGDADTLRDAERAIAPRGRIVVLGVFSGSVVLDPWPVLLKEATLTWSLCYSRPEGGSDFEEAIRLLAEDPDLFARVLTHQVPLARVDRAFALAADKTSGAIKVTVTP